jgi:hypothetical protein
MKEIEKKKLIDLLKTFDIKKLDRETLSDLIYLHDSSYKQSFFERIIEALNSVNLDNKEFDHKETQLRIDVILLRFSQKKYMRKVAENDLILYEYEDSYDLYFSKKINVKSLTNYIDELNYSFFEIYYKDKGKFKLLTLSIVDANSKITSCSKKNKNIELIFLELKLEDYLHSLIKIKLIKKDKIKELLEIKTKEIKDLLEIKTKENN